MPLSRRIAVLGLLLPSTTASAQIDTVPRVEHFPGSSVIRVEYAVAKTDPTLRHGTYAAYRFSGLRDSVGRYDAGRREGPWLLYDELGRAAFREHYTDGQLVERVALRRLPIRTHNALPADTTGLSAHDLLLYALARSVRYPAHAREQGLAGWASVLVICNDAPGVIHLRADSASHPFFLSAIAEALRGISAVAPESGLAERLCREGVAEVRLQFVLE